MIFWFSGTGNSQWLAQCLQEATKEQAYQITHDLICGETTFTLKNNERIGFVFPIHGWNIPDVVRRFIKDLTLANYRENYMYFACTCGDDMGTTEKQATCLFASKGWKLHSAFAVRMPNTYVCLPGFNVDPDSIEQAKINAALQTARTICEMVLDRRSGKHMTIPGKMPWTKTHVIGGFFRKYLMDRRHFHMTDKCNGCGKCQEVCSLKNINMEEGHPTWGRECALCLACYHHCPTHAIEYGKMTRNKGQYKNTLL